MSRKVTNPLTGHKIQVGGGTYNSLVRQGVISQRGGFGRCTADEKAYITMFFLDYINVFTAYLNTLLKDTEEEKLSDVDKELVRDSIQKHLDSLRTRLNFDKDSMSILIKLANAMKNTNKNPFFSAGTFK